MAYVPPALRRKQEAALQGKDERSDHLLEHQSTSSSTTHRLRSLKDIQKHFWPNWVPEVLALTHKSPAHSADAKGTDHGSDQHAPIGRGDISVSQENTSIKLEIAPSEFDHSNEANAKSLVHSDASPQPQQLAQYELKEPKQSSASLTHQHGNYFEFEELSSDRNKSCLTKGNDDMAQQSREDPGTNPPVFEAVHPHNTLNSTERDPDSLQYILLFHDANPRWRSNRIIFVKSALELLPTNLKQEDEAQVQTIPQESLAKNIMIFEQQNGHQIPTSAIFRFIGYFNLTKMQILEPCTPELVSMQEQKWTRTDKYGRPKPINRNAEGWKKSLSQRWAVLGFEKNEEATKELGVPEIEISTKRDSNGEVQKETKSVNDMLKEMRLKDNS